VHSGPITELIDDMGQSTDTYALSVGNHKHIKNISIASRAGHERETLVTVVCLSEHLVASTAQAAAPNRRAPENRRPDRLI